MGVCAYMYIHTPHRTATPITSNAPVDSKVTIRFPLHQHPCY